MQLIWMLYATYIDLYWTLQNLYATCCAIICNCRCVSSHRFVRIGYFIKMFIIPKRIFHRKAQPRHVGQRGLTFILSRLCCEAVGVLLGEGCHRLRVRPASLCAALA